MRMDIFTPWHLLAFLAVACWSLRNPQGARWGWALLACLVGGVVLGVPVLLWAWFTPARRAVVMRRFWLQRADIDALSTREQQHMQDQLDLWKRHAAMDAAPSPERKRQFARESAALAARHERYKQRVQQAVHDEQRAQLRKEQ